MKTPEQISRDILERMDIDNAQSFTAGDVVELSNVISILQKVRPYIAEYRDAAESEHDNPDSEYYMDLTTYEEMISTGQILSDIDRLFNAK